ncbi:hypothetical protein B4U80_02467 [Leptotrombidium deliense]|uniref:Uncharacterized protein n=1 Tax=Leptotrombidium deliense TaxID=299467 RepID=A0A443S4D8_9ACAR|nr:hypothetical protein B4U80_02467 [Leptotrombidium deliense]
MNEMKTVIANVLRNFSVRPLLPTEDIIVSIEIITRTKSKLLVEFIQRT